MFNFSSRGLFRAACFLIALPMVALAGDFVIPELRSPIIDTADFVQGSTRSRLENALQNIHTTSGLQIAALIIPSLSGMTIEDASIRVTDAWKLGSKEQDKGVLLLIAVAEKQIRIEVGQGLEGEIPDALAKRIIEERVTPLMRGGDRDGALTVALYSIAQAAFPDKDMRAYFEETPLPNSTHQQGRPLSATELIFLGLLLFLLLFTRMGRNILFFALMVSGRGGQGGFGGRGKSSGGYGGGGGGFSGGGASGGW